VKGAKLTVSHSVPRSQHLKRNVLSSRVDCLKSTSGCLQWTECYCGTCAGNACS